MLVNDVSVIIHAAYLRYKKKVEVEYENIINHIQL